MACIQFDEAARRQFEADYLADIADLRREFAAVDRADPESLRAFFDTHSYLTRSETAIVARVGVDTVGRWRRLAGCARAVKFIPRVPQRRRIASIAVPPDWATREWLESQLASHSTVEIARAVGRSRAWVRRLLRRFGLQAPPVHPRNPCWDRSWLLAHYVGRGWSLARCGRAAGVCRQTIARWLTDWGIRIRWPGEPP
jgi:hypothetical protein